jgi:hypothetical protein
MVHAGKYGMFNAGGFHYLRQPFTDNFVLTARQGDYGLAGRVPRRG